MRRHLFEPLEMGETLFHHEGPIDPASLAFESSGGDPQVEEPWIRRALGPAGGTVWSTVDDLLTLARVHLRDGVVGSGVPYTPPGMLAGMRASHAEPRIPDWLDGWGLGLGRWDWPRATAFGWDGVGVGFRSFLRFIPQLSIAIILLTNTSTGRKLYRSFLRELLPQLGGPELLPDRFDVTAMPAERLRRFAGAYGIPDRTVVVRAIHEGLRIEGMDDVSVVRPLDDRVFLVDPDGADIRTVVFAPEGTDGRPLALYDLVWALPRLGS